MWEKLVNKIKQSLQLSGVSGWIAKSIALVIAGVFLIAGISKLKDVKSFEIVVASYGILPDSWVAIGAIALPVLEVVAAIGLIFNRKWALNLIGVMTLGFILVLSYGIWMGLDVDCGCFGVNDPEHSAFSQLRSALFKDILLLIAIGYLFVRSPKKIRFGQLKTN